MATRVGSAAVEVLAARALLPESEIALEGSNAGVGDAADVMAASALPLESEVALADNYAVRATPPAGSRRASVPSPLSLRATAYTLETTSRCERPVRHLRALLVGGCGRKAAAELHSGSRRSMGRCGWSGCRDCRNVSLGPWVAPAA